MRAWGFTQGSGGILGCRVVIRPLSKQKSSLSDRFIAPPFSILDTKQGYWQQRKKQWLALGIQGELGRGGEAENAPHRGLAKSFTNFRGVYTYPVKSLMKSGTSIFDPVLAELVYRWFCTDNGVVLDPFAGGSVRGIVASKLNLQYIGIELRPEQVIANRIQGEDICKNSKYPPIWYIGDSREVKQIVSESVDLIFSCPPYGNLEVYSDDPRDISTLEYCEFLAAYEEIIVKCVSRLKPNRFACFVVGDIRCGDGFYRNFVAHTISAFQYCGCYLYNEAIIINPLGSLPIRAGKYFQGARKLGKAHQNLLAFFNGNPKNIKEIYGEFNANASPF